MRIILTALVLALHGCSPSDTQGTELAQVTRDSVLARLRDPESARFDSITVHTLSLPAVGG